MSLRSKAETILKSIASFQDGEWLVECEDEGHSLRCRLNALDTLGCAFQTFEVENAALKSAKMDRLKQVAESLSRRLNYLLEPISPIEVDHEQCTVQLRSNPPQKDENGTSYYELLVAAGGRLSLCRFKKVAGNPRHPIPAQVTREVILRLVADFASAG
ncbi:MAG TPA: hypothetical protein VKB78_09815 [Pirellulales bacterium]|nr:hypothetical protein [Pirellulales bacterium]